MLRFRGQCNGQSADDTPYSAGSARNHRRSGRLYAPWESSGGALLAAMCTRDVASSPMGSVLHLEGPWGQVGPDPRSGAPRGQSNGQNAGGVGVKRAVN